MKASLALLIAVIGCAVGALPLEAGTGRYASEPTRLVIHRSANFGTYMSINVYIDGVHAGNIAFNKKYDAYVPSGHHVIALEQTPRRGAALIISEQRVNLAPGGTAVFTVVTTDGGAKAVLQGS
jgi:hypothetical protein